MSNWKKVVELGMEVWFDDLSRELVTSGKLKKMIEVDGLSGITSNPTIFENSIKNNSVYLEDIRKLSISNKEPEMIYDELLIHDIKMAAQVFEELFHNSEGELGYVSLEISPLLAHDVEKTVQEVKRITGEVSAENIMVKIPATEEGIVAIEKLVSEGFNINATLIFSVSQYEKVAKAYIQGLQERLKKGLSVQKIKGVASVFLSRLDTLVDKKLEAIINDNSVAEARKKKALELKGRSSTALGRLVYKKFLELFDSQDFAELEERGAWVQKPLWASTGTKNPQYSDVKYVEEHIYPDSVITVPGQTFDAFKDHGKALLAELDFEEQEKVVTDLKELGIDLEATGQELMIDGEKKFVDSYLNILNLIKSYL